MRRIIVRQEEAGQRFDKFLRKYMREAPVSFFYKMLRKKNITLNGQKADGSERIREGDRVEMFLSDETIEKFCGVQDCPGSGSREESLCLEGEAAWKKFGALPVLYEDRHILLVDKPAGILTQKSMPDDLSLNEWLTGYLLASGALGTDRKQARDSLRMFRPSVCNRLDRNTSGIVICGKSLYGSQQMSRILKDRSLHKYYLLYVEGKLREARRVEGWLVKDETTNKVRITREQTEESAKIVTAYRPIREGEHETLVEVDLITGKPHQIRAHLAAEGFPLVGDYKYGDRRANDKRKRQDGITHQLLHAYRVVFPVLDGELSALSGREIRAPLPDIFQKLKGQKR
ncbi:RluA family pseudouridine synthase [Lachnospiraceae bacterium JLR.KK008]